VDKVCGKPTGEPSTMPPNWSEVTTSRMTSPPLSPTPPSSQEALGKLAHLRSSFYSKHSLRATTREFLMYLQRYKSFFSVLPEVLCEGDNVVDDSTCWSGGDVVESYTAKVVGNGLQAQRQNPEVKVRSPDPYLEEVKKRLEQFNQETQESFPDMDQNSSWDDLGSGEVEESSGTDCDDEDGCQASGDGKDMTCIRRRRPSLTPAIGPRSSINSQHIPSHILPASMLPASVWNTACQSASGTCAVTHCAA
ncbi:unnamed protein product, partial [Gadus morhua 'NCC']